MDKLFILLILLFIGYKIYTTVIVTENYDGFIPTSFLAEYKKAGPEIPAEAKAEIESENDELLYNRQPQLIYDDPYYLIPYYNPYYMPYYLYNPYYNDTYNQKTFNRNYRWSTSKTHRNIYLNKNKQY